MRCTASCPPAGAEQKKAVVDESVTLLDTSRLMAVVDSL